MNKREILDKLIDIRRSLFMLPMLTYEQREYINQVRDEIEILEDEIYLQIKNTKVKEAFHDNRLDKS